MLSNLDLKRDNDERYVRRVRNERRVRDGASIVLLFQVF